MHRPYVGNQESRALTADAVTEVSAMPLLDVSWLLTPATPPPGQPFTCTITVTNRGSMPARSVLFTNCRVELDDGAGHTGTFRLPEHDDPPAFCRGPVLPAEAPVVPLHGPASWLLRQFGKHIEQVIDEDDGCVLLHMVRTEPGLVAA